MVLCLGLLFLILPKNKCSNIIHFVPFTKFDNLAENFSSRDSEQKNLITTKLYYQSLKTKYPYIIYIPENKIDTYLDKGFIALLPWWQAKSFYKCLKIENKFFFDDPAGSLLIKSNLKSPVLPQQITKIAAGGTVVLARGIGEIIDTYKNPYLPWYGTKKIFRKADFSLVNFKSPLVYNYRPPQSRWLLYGRDSYASGLVYAGIDLVSLSGNHMGDANFSGLFDTIKILKKAGITSVGAGKTHQEAYRPYFFQHHHTLYAFFAFNSVPGSINKASAKPKTKPGIAWLDQDALIAVKKATKRADIIIVITNWGKEYKAKPTPAEIKWGRKLIDAGADIVLGDQAHWVQNHEFYKDKFIAYGLGNFIFDQSWSEKTKEGILVNFYFLQNNLLNIKIIPVKLKSKGVVKIVENQKTHTAIMKQFYGRQE